MSGAKAHPDDIIILPFEGSRHLWSEFEDFQVVYAGRTTGLRGISPRIIWVDGLAWAAMSPVMREDVQGREVEDRASVRRAAHFVPHAPPSRSLFDRVARWLEDRIIFTQAGGA